MFTPVSVFLRPSPNLSMTTTSQLHALNFPNDQTLNCNLITWKKILKRNSSRNPMFAARRKTWHTAPTISCPSLSTFCKSSTCCHFKLNPATPSWSRGMFIIFGFQMTSWGLESISNWSKVTQTPSEGAPACTHGCHYAVFLNNTPNTEYSKSI